MNWIYVFLGGGIGSILRYSISQIFKFDPLRNNFPWGTFIANMTSCIIAGVIISLIQKNTLPDSSRVLLISGFCGGFSTFSAMSIESLTMWQNGNHLMFFTYILISIIAGIGMVLLGNSFV